MFLRDAPTTTLAELGGLLEIPTEALSLYGADISLDLMGGTDVIRVGEREIPASEASIEIIAAWLSMPMGFLKRIDPDLKQHVLNALCQRNPEHIVVRITPGDTIASISTPLQKMIEPRQLIEVAIKVLGEDALVDSYEMDPLSFRFDVMFADGANHGIGGDPAINDITKGGLRFWHTNKGNLAPGVQEWLYRLLCTNGMEMADAGIRVDARGGTVETVLAFLEAEAGRAISRVEDKIKHFYELRERPVENPERTLNRMAIEAGLSERMRHRLIDRVPVVLGHDGGSISEFDLVNLVTNTANDPEIKKWGEVRKLQIFGGSLVHAQAERCNTCASKLTV